MNDNSLTVEVYSSGTTRINDLGGYLAQVSDLRFATIYPGGLYADCSFWMPKKLTDKWQLEGGQRISIYNKVTPVYEGYIERFENVADGDGERCIVYCVGAWSHILMTRRTNKIWCDTRVEENVWVYPNIAYNALDITYRSAAKIERNAQIKITPAAVLWYNNEYVRVVYYAPTGQTIKKVYGTLAWNEGGGAYTFGIYNQDEDAADFTTTGGGGNIDTTISPPSTAVWLYLQNASGGNQTPADDMSTFATITNLAVMTETTNATMKDVAEDLISLFSDDLNSSTAHLDTPASSRTLAGGSGATGSLPFGAFNNETLAEILTLATRYGDEDNNAWAVGVLHSDTAGTPDGKPLVFLEQYPDLTGYDYVVRFEDINVNGTISLTQDFSQMANWLTVAYTDMYGKQAYYNADDSAFLKDQTSINKYGRRDGFINPGQGDDTSAMNYGMRYLARYKDPVWVLTSPISIMGSIETADGLRIPASQVRAGKRLRIENVGFDLTGSGTAATFLISHTEYDDNSETVSITVGPPPDLITPIFYVQPSPGPRYEEPEEGASGGGRGQKPHRGHKWDWEKNPSAHRGRWGERE